MLSGYFARILNVRDGNYIDAHQERYEQYLCERPLLTTIALKCHELLLAEALLQKVFVKPPCRQEADSNEPLTAQVIPIAASDRG
jgi:hypothetical protein